MRRYRQSRVDRNRRKRAVRSRQARLVPAYIDLTDPANAETDASETDDEVMTDDTASTDDETETDDESTRNESEASDENTASTGQEATDSFTPKDREYESLVDIDGIGAAKARWLQDAGFESVSDLRAASPEELATARGVSVSLAETFLSELGAESSTGE